MTKIKSLIRLGPVGLESRSLERLKKEKKDGLEANYGF
jgi:hypothetical protein